MPDLPPDLLAAGLIVTAGAVVQSAVGFGMGLVIIPLLLWSGRPLPEAVAVVLGAALVQTAYGSWKVRASVPWKLTLRLAVVQWIALPVGVLGMATLAAAGPTVVKQVVGGLLAGILVLRAIVRPVPMPAVAMRWGVVAAASAGLLAGLVGMGGPPLVLYALAHDWASDKFRGFLWATFLLSLGPAVAVLVLHFGVQLLWSGLLGICLAPFLWVGARAGMAVSKRWEAATIRRLATALLVAIAAWSILAPLLAGN